MRRPTCPNYIRTSTQCGCDAHCCRAQNPLFCQSRVSMEKVLPVKMLRWLFCGFFFLKDSLELLREPEDTLKLCLRFTLFFLCETEVYKHKAIHTLLNRLCTGVNPYKTSHGLPITLPLRTLPERYAFKPIHYKVFIVEPD